MPTSNLQQKRLTARQEVDAADLKVLVCIGSPCMAGGAGEILNKLTEVYGQSMVRVTGTGCIGPCSRGPLIKIHRKSMMPVYYERMTPQQSMAAVDALLFESDYTTGSLPADLPFLAEQQRIVLANCGITDPENLDSTLAAGGYTALEMVLTGMKPEEVCAAINQSGLRGRGGAGYPTGLKWDTVRQAKGSRKYVVANGDEGDPGAFMDRTLMESDPHRLLEGMIIAGYVVDALCGFIYVRAEYPLAAARLAKAITDAEQTGLLGENILDSGFSFRIKVRIGAGAFVCGEETALMASIMGRRGQPNNRPPYPARRGLWGTSTLINNVETFGSVAAIIENGADWFRAIGAPGNSGTKVFSISGDVATVGVLEVPLGTPLERLVKMAGGVTGGKLKAALSGGASGGCIPAEHQRITMDYDSLKRLGTMLGSGGLIVMNDRHCMLNLALFFMRFCQDESCGKCSPCRIGTVEAALLLERISIGHGRPDDLDTLEELCLLMQQGSLCGLGLAAPTPVLSTLRWFRDEYREHLEGRCPSGICRIRAASGL